MGVVLRMGHTFEFSNRSIGGSSVLKSLGLGNSITEQFYGNNNNRMRQECKSFILSFIAYGLDSHCYIDLGLELVLVLVV